MPKAPINGMDGYSVDRNQQRLVGGNEMEATTLIEAKGVQVVVRCADAKH